MAYFENLNLRSLSVYILDNISQGAIQKAIDMVSSAIKTHYDGISKEAQCSSVANIDETYFPLKKRWRTLSDIFRGTHKICGGH